MVNCSKNESSGGSDVFKRTDTVSCEGKAIEGEYLVRWKDGSISVEHFDNDKKFIKDFLEKNKSKIVSSEPHYKILVSHGEVVHQRDWGGEVNWGVEAIEASSAWNKNNQGEDVVVAIIDSGFDSEHPELMGTLAVNENEEMNGLDDDGNGLVDDRYGYDFVSDSAEMTDHTGHGTHIAGVIAAQHGVGSIDGAAPNVKLLPLNFISKNGSGSVDGAISAIRYAAKRGAKVINASWGGEACSQSLRDEIAALTKSNVLFVTAAGNSGNDISALPEYPAAFVLSNQITVGASTFDNKTAGFSNYGDLVDLVAPGAYVISTYPEEFDLYDEAQDGLTALNGTSMAAPFVAAAAALLWSHKPDASFVEIKQALVGGVTDGPYPVKSRGLLNVAGALSALNP